MLTRILALFSILFAISGCFRGRLQFHFSNCESGARPDKYGRCDAAAVDRSAPSVVLSSGTSSTNANPILVTATFSADVEYFSISSIALTNATVSNLSGAGSIYTLAITPLQEGVITISLAAGAAVSKAAGVASTASNQLSITYDNTAPVLTFVSLNRSTPLDVGPSSDPTLQVSMSEAAFVTLYDDSTCLVAISQATPLQGLANQSIKADAIKAASKVRIHGKGVDAAGNVSACTSLVTYTHIQKFIDPNPVAGNGFGTHIVELKNGNVVISAPTATVGGVTNAGAVYLFSGETGALISTLHGSTTDDRVGEGGITALANGNFVVRSQNWDCQATLGCSGGVSNAGAATWGSGVSGVNGPVNSSNSLVGRYDGFGGDEIANNGVVALTNGNYVVASSRWTCFDADGCSGMQPSVGAATWGNGLTGVAGFINASNSLIGALNSDFVGGSGVRALTNGNYVVASRYWDCSVAAGCPTHIANAGAATWGNGATGTVGFVSLSNSLVGGTADDDFAINGVTALANGNYVVGSQHWNCRTVFGCDVDADDVGAVTWGNGSSGTFGFVTASNSLVGSSALDRLGSSAVHALTNGNYVVGSHVWNCRTTLGCAADVNFVGAATWGNGATGTFGPVTATNSLVGSGFAEFVAQSGIRALANGNYVVRSTNDVGGPGSVTWGDGSTGTTGVVGIGNSLLGSTANDNVGENVIALSNGNYVVVSRQWNCLTTRDCASNVADVGAITLGSGTAPTTGYVRGSNSIVGSTASDQLGSGGAITLSNGNYVFSSPLWDCTAAAGCSGTITDVGAVTWMSGTASTTGMISSSNSLIGSTANDQVGSGGLTALSNGNYIVRSPNWDCLALLGCFATIADVGAVTWADGAAGLIGVVNASNSLVGSTASDQLGNSTATATADGKLIFNSSLYGASDLGLVIKIPGDESVAGSL